MGQDTGAGKGFRQVLQCGERVVAKQGNTGVVRTLAGNGNITITRATFRTRFLGFFIWPPGDGRRRAAYTRSQLSITELCLRAGRLLRPPTSLQRPRHVQAFRGFCATPNSSPEVLLRLPTARRGAPARRSTSPSTQRSCALHHLFLRDPFGHHRRCSRIPV